MNDFVNNLRAVSISYSSRIEEVDYTLLQRQAYNVFFEFLCRGAMYKKDSLKWFLCKYWLYSNCELQELYLKKYGKMVSANTLNVTRYNLCKSLEKNLGDNFFETFCEQDNPEIADKLAQELIIQIKTLELHDKKFVSLFTDEILNIDAELTNETYSIEDLKTELDVLRDYTKVVIEEKVSKLDKGKLAYIRMILNEDTFTEGELNIEKMKLLKVLLWG